MTKPSLPARLRPEIDSLENSKIAEVWMLGFGREKLIPLWVGEGDLPTPAFIGEAAFEAFKAGKTFYNQKRGIPELRQAIADYTNHLYGTTVDSYQVTVTSSGMSAIMQIMQVVAGPGDNVVVVSPVWPNIYGAIQIVGAELRPVLLRAREDGRFALDLEELFAATDDRTRALFIASPGNPTGWMMEREDQQQVLDFCRQKGIWWVADEVYARFTYDRPRAPSALEIAAPDDPVIVVNSFSKAWAMTGWRMGWMITPPQLCETFDIVIEYNTSGAPHFLQYGCIAALREGEAVVKEMVERCRQGGELVYRELAKLPRVTVARPQASFYSFFAVDGMTDSLATAKQILADVDVGLAPGAAFGPGGEGHLRLCFATSQERLSKALERLSKFFK